MAESLGAALILVVRVAPQDLQPSTAAAFGADGQVRKAFCEPGFHVSTCPGVPPAAWPGLLWTMNPDCRSRAGSTSDRPPPAI